MAIFCSQPIVMRMRRVGTMRIPKTPGRLAPSSLDSPGRGLRPCVFWIAHRALGQSADALKDINLASDLPHADRSTLERYNLKISAIRKRIEAARREVDLRELEDLRSQVRAEAELREPPPKPAPPPPPIPGGNISYEIETRAPIEVVEAVFPDYPEPLR